MELNEVTFDEIDRYLKMSKQKGAKVLSVLGKIAPEVNQIFSTEIGRTMLSDDILRAEELMGKTWDGTITDSEKQEFNYLSKIRIPRVLEKLNVYLKATGVIKKTVGGNGGKAL
jgi:hypothetical protein